MIELWKFTKLMRKNDFLKKITETYITGVEAFAHLLLCLKKKDQEKFKKKKWTFCSKSGTLVKKKGSIVN